MAGIFNQHIGKSKQLKKHFQGKYPVGRHRYFKDGAPVPFIATWRERVCQVNLF